LTLQNASQSQLERGVRNVRAQLERLRDEEKGAPQQRKRAACKEQSATRSEMCALPATIAHRVETLAIVSQRVRAGDESWQRGQR
jgi:hypothetical protein